jgi:hypothetical protein
MKTPIIIIALALFLIGLIVGISICYTSLPMPTDSHQDQTEPPTCPVTGGELKINNLAASLSGNVSLDVTLYEGDSGPVEAVIINGTSYSWSEGSSENSTILKGQTKSWSKNIGGLNADDTVKVTIQASPNNATGTTNVNPLPNPSAPDDSDEHIVPDRPSYFYDFYSSVGLFERGVYFVATSQDPLTQLPRSDLPRSYWELMWENATILATDQDFISIIVSRGDFPTGGYTLQVEAFNWLESYPVKFRFQVNFTDPGEGVAVTQAFTNPSLLVPIGQLSPGKYQVEIHIVSYILTFDEQGNPNYRPIMTFKEEVWTQTLTIEDSEEPESLTTFKVSVNTNPFSDLTVPVELTSGVTKEKAELIAKSTFIQVKSENVLYRLDDLTFDRNQINARFTWGIDTNDMGHIFELTADLSTLQIAVTHCL